MTYHRSVKDRREKVECKQTGLVYQKVEETNTSYNRKEMFKGINKCSRVL